MNIMFELAHYFIGVQLFKRQYEWNRFHYFKFYISFGWTKSILIGYSKADKYPREWDLEFFKWKLESYWLREYSDFGKTVNITHKYKWTRYSL